jgi:hypothetical protein
MHPSSITNTEKVVGAFISGILHDCMIEIPAEKEWQNRIFNLYLS